MREIPVFYWIWNVSRLNTFFIGFYILFFFITFRPHWISTKFLQTGENKIFLSSQKRKITFKLYVIVIYYYYHSCFITVIATLNFRNSIWQNVAKFFSIVAEPQFVLHLPNGSERKTLLLAVLVVVLLVSVAAFYTRCWLPLALLYRDKFGRLEENGECISRE